MQERAGDDFHAAGATAQRAAPQHSVRCRHRALRRLCICVALCRCAAIRAALAAALLLVCPPSPLLLPGARSELELLRDRSQHIGAVVRASPLPLTQPNTSRDISRRYKMLSHAKTVILFAIGIAFNAQPVAARQWLGAAMTFSGVVWYVPHGAGVWGQRALAFVAAFSQNDSESERQIKITAACPLRLLPETCCGTCSAQQTKPRAEDFQNAATARFGSLLALILRVVCEGAFVFCRGSHRSVLPQKADR